MTKLFSSLVLAFVVAWGTPVLGGSRAWESRLSLRPLDKPSSLDPIPVNVAGYAIRAATAAGNASSDGGLRKRYFAVAPGQGNKPSRLWPDKTISYCYDSEASRAAIEEPLKAAIQVWHAAGLHRDVYKWVKVADPGTACTNNAQRGKILVISHNNEGRLSTTLALPFLDGRDRDVSGPTMQLSAVDTVGQLNIVANFAHEIGHAWGLMHEHQNPKFWSSPYYYEATPEFAGTVFGTYFDCTALKDYHLVMQRIEDAYREEVDGLRLATQTKRDVCVKQSAANDWAFSAADWLPVPANYIDGGISPINAGEDDVDWDSIMLYPSGAGGIGSARGPTGPDENPDAYDQRMPVLRRNNGQKIRPNAVPSARDVAGIRKLYDSPQAREHEGGAFVLPNDKKHSLFPDFIKDLVSRKGKDCNRRP